MHGGVMLRQHVPPLAVGKATTAHPSLEPMWGADRQ